ncbi:2Fe-2S iron-sulfur cluster-binding protein [Candidatus Contendibacter odensensis]|uniref:NADH-quinone oxidoreductase subunit G n=1 Tax=Candidatus Contendobacter odensis Run_B_J11 TaxID=1400861 RepID=A0A7U7J395_9GAMM|nr:2Fe-2S iron-sulfur cluster-binding protein [Candidatus Contendobacter odensis]MBK8752793.1 (2Fe-2S)-binding protein [Candidatus Competibacteraceae bacterium]CDH44354.1 Hydrogen dehydrogenase [Candidatus Contendobacter odensis Run_B_J11]
MSGEPSFTLDDQPVPFQDGQTIMEAARVAGVYIPHLCFNPDFAPHGSCRVCLVKVNGRPQAACTTPAVAGQVVQSEIEELQEIRRGILEMMFVEGNHICPACEKSGACQLQAVAYYVGMLAPRFTYFYPQRTLDASHPDAVIDFNRCILCELCVRASRDIDGKNVFAVQNRGLKAHLVINTPSGKLGATTFSITDKAAQVCPTGAILIKNRGYETPIGRRLYDRQPVNVVGDVAQVPESEGGRRHE